MGTSTLGCGRPEVAVVRSEHPTDEPFVPKGPGPAARGRRRASVGRVWAIYRKSAMGLAGLIILIAFGTMAVLAPVLVDPDRLDVTKVEGPVLAPPSLDYPMGTDEAGRSVLDLVIWGSRVSLMVGLLAAAVSMIVGSAVGIF